MSVSGERDRRCDEDAGRVGRSGRVRPADRHRAGRRRRPCRDAGHRLSRPALWLRTPLARRHHRPRGRLSAPRALHPPGRRARGRGRGDGCGAGPGASGAAQPAVGRGPLPLRIDGPAVPDLRTARAPQARSGPQAGARARRLRRAGGGYTSLYLHTDPAVPGAEPFWRSLAQEVCDERTLPGGGQGIVHFELPMPAPRDLAAPHIR